MDSLGCLLCELFFDVMLCASSADERDESAPKKETAEENHDSTDKGDYTWPRNP